MKLGERPTLRDEIADELRRRILAGELSGGQRLAEVALSEELGVSRISLREAFRVLEAEMLVEWLPRRGVRVIEPDPAELGVVEDVRMELELYALSLAGERLDDDWRARLEQFIEDGNRASEAGDVAELAAANRRFHELLAESCGSPVLQQLLRTIRQRSRQFQPSGDDGRVQESWDDHAEIVSSLLRSDVGGAQRRMRIHLTQHRNESLASFDVS
ncbi:MAG: GntR family transcriptional regulator [Actinomycetota bacterium]|nr:GntR family transcriptional regulator [Actinomycetota bacterium]